MKLVHRMIANIYKRYSTYRDKTIPLVMKLLKIFMETMSRLNCRKKNHNSFHLSFHIPSHPNLVNTAFHVLIEGIPLYWQEYLIIVIAFAAI